MDEGMPEFDEEATDRLIAALTELTAEIRKFSATRCAMAGLPLPPARVQTWTGVARIPPRDGDDPS